MEVRSTGHRHTTRMTEDWLTRRRSWGEGVVPDGAGGFRSVNSGCSGGDDKQDRESKKAVAPPSPSSSRSQTRPVVSATQQQQPSTPVRLSAKKKKKQQSSASKTPDTVQTTPDADHQLDENVLDSHAATSSPIPLSHVHCIQQAFGADCDLYKDVLKVGRLANERQIRIAYFRRGRAVLAQQQDGSKIIGEHLTVTHRQRFQAVSMAYEILSKPDMKAWYDQHHWDGINNNTSISPPAEEDEDVLSIGSGGSILRSSSSKDQHHQQQQPGSRSSSRGRIRWNEQVEELLFKQDPEERSFKANMSNASMQVVVAEVDQEAGLYNKKKKDKKRIILEEEEALTQRLQQLDKHFVSDLLDDFEASLDGFSLEAMSFDGIEASIDGLVRYLSDGDATAEDESSIRKKNNNKHFKKKKNAVKAEAMTPQEPEQQKAEEEKKEDDQQDEIARELFADLTKPAPSSSDLRIRSKSTSPAPSKGSSGKGNSSSSKAPSFKQEPFVSKSATKATKPKKKKKDDSSPLMAAARAFDPFAEVSPGDDTFEDIEFEDTTMLPKEELIEPTDMVVTGKQRHQDDGTADSVSTMSASEISHRAPQDHPSGRLSSGERLLDRVPEADIESSPQYPGKKTIEQPRFCMPNTNYSGELKDQKQQSPFLSHDKIDPSYLIVEPTRSGMSSLTGIGSTLSPDRDNNGPGPLTDLCGRIGRVASTTTAADSKQVSDQQENPAAAASSKPDNLLSPESTSGDDFLSHLSAYVTALSNEIAKFGSQFSTKVEEANRAIVESLTLPEEDIQGMLDVLGPESTPIQRAKTY